MRSIQTQIQWVVLQCEMNQLIGNPTRLEVYKYSSPDSIKPIKDHSPNVNLQNINNSKIISWIFLAFRKIIRCSASSVCQRIIPKDEPYLFWMVLDCFSDSFIIINVLPIIMRYQGDNSLYDKISWNFWSTTNNPQGWTLTLFNLWLFFITHP